VDDKISLQALVLANRLQKRFRHLKKWARASGQKTETGAFRLYDRDIPEIPLVLDFYGDSSLPQEAALCGALYKRPYDKDFDEEKMWLSVMKKCIASALRINPENIFIKQRQKQKGVLQYEKISDTHYTKIIQEGSLFFKINLTDYLDTGLFIDRRLLRNMIRMQAAGKNVLNLFSYTGSFSVYAASGGALSTDSVDLSNTYLNWSHENFSLNGMNSGFLQQWDFFSRNCPKNTNNLIRSDVLDFLEKAIAAKMRWDIIILDPPAFSNSKKMTDNFDLQRDLTGLLINCLKLLASGGKIFLSINLRRSAPTADELEKELKAQTGGQSAHDFKNLHVIDLGNKVVDEDFRGRKVPKAYLIMVNS